MNKEETQEEAIKRLEKERDDLLKEHPELQPLQDKIDKVLTKAGSNQTNRCAAIQNLMLSTWAEIVPVWTEDGYAEQYTKEQDKELRKSKFKLLH